VPVGRLADLRAEFESRRAEVAPAVMEVADRNFDFTPPGAVRAPRSLIVVAVPHACAHMTVVVDGEELVLPIPTTYCHHDEIQTAVVAALAAGLGAGGLSVARMRLPEKLLAVCAGVALYGRNNIAYVGDYGSFVELVACVSDLEPGVDPWCGPRSLPRCDSCEACRRACPSGAIGSDRFLLHGERCLTLANESEQPFPEWVEPAWHHCLVGCLRCQRACPEDHGVRDETAETAAFDERETRLLLAGVDHGLLEGELGLRDKLGDLGLLGYDDEFLAVVLARNLRALLDAR
jgi:epoxyqueuosine reductase